VVTRKAIRLALSVAALACATSGTVDARTPKQVYRIGFILTAAPSSVEHLTKAFEAGLRDLGYVEGRNVVFERRWAEGRPERLPGLAADLVKKDVDVILSGANPVVAALKSVTTTIPIVMVTSMDPVGSGFIASLARPGGNITGMTADPTPEIHGKRLQLLKELVPKAARVAVLWNPLSPGANDQRKDLEQAARKLGLTLLLVEARGRDEFADAFAAMARGGADSLMELSDPLFFTNRKQVVELITKHRLPAIHARSEAVEIGSLMSYGASLADQFRRAAVYVDKIIKGAKPGDIPVEQGAKFDLVINQNAARQLGLAIPMSLRHQADQIIE